MKKSTLKSYNDLFKTTDGNTAKFYVLYNTNLTYLLSSNEIVTFYQIVHVCNIGRNYASLNYLARLLNQSNKTVQKSINKLLLLNLITREKNYSGAYYYTLNLEVIKEIYDKLNSCFKLEDREHFCLEYIASCTESSGDVPMEKFTTPMEKNSTPMENFTIPMEKITTPPMEKFTTHISNIDIKEDDLNKKDEFNKENEFHNKDVEVGEVANADVTNEMADANSSFNNFDSSTNVDKESVSTDDVIEEMFPEKPKDKKEQANANNPSRVADANSSFNINYKSSKNNSNKTAVSIENKKECNSLIKEESSNREPENNVSVDVIDKEKSSSNDVVTIDETALAKDYYQRVVYAESLEELESLSTEIKQLPMKENYISELLQLIETTSEQFNEDSDDASEFDLNESLNNNPIFARVYNTVLASLSRNSLATLLSFKEQLKNDIDELSTEEAVELQNLVEDCIMKLQAGYSNVA